MKKLFRIIIIGSAALIIGVAANQWIPNGIRWPLLLLSIPGASGSLQGEDFISVYPAYALLDSGDVCFMDIRPLDEFDIDHITGAISLPFLDLFIKQDRIESWSKDSLIIIYCFEPDCKEAKMAFKRLKSLGFNRIKVLEGGFAAWLENDFPAELGE